jgi:hypothetical protein
VDVCSRHVASVARGVHEFVHVKDRELCCVGFEGGEAVAEVGCGAVTGCSREFTHRGDGGAEWPAGLALDGVEIGIAEETELEGEVLADEASSNDTDSAGLCERRGG